jgi:polyisoprenoid-binding protein YceI
MGATLTRTRDRSLPQAGTWAIDPSRAALSFSGRASFLTPTISARFPDVSGSIAVGELGEEGEVDVTVDVRTMTTGNRAYDEVIAGFDPFDARRHPTATYRSRGVTWAGDEARIDGVLTLRGVSRPVALTASYAVGRPGRMLVRGGGTIDREQFGVRFDVPGLSKIVPRQMRLEIDVDATYLG